MSTPRRTNTRYRHIIWLSSTDWISYVESELIILLWLKYRPMDEHTCAYTKTHYKCVLCTSGWKDSSHNYHECNSRNQLITNNWISFFPPLYFPMLFSFLIILIFTLFLYIYVLESITVPYPFCSSSFSVTLFLFLFLLLSISLTP